VVPGVRGPLRVSWIWVVVAPGAEQPIPVAPVIPGAPGGAVNRKSLPFAAMVLHRTGRSKFTITVVAPH
jgi:hypothetical protein